jgi:hypothetical protein
MPVYFLASCFLNIIVLVFLLMVAKMICKLRRKAVDAFKFNHRTTNHFRKNQYVIESLSFYLLAIVCSGMLKLPLGIFELLSK